MALLCSRCPHQLTIKPRSKGALGFAQYLPNETNLHSKQELLDQIVVLLGGRCAEQEFFGQVTTGASDDLQKARGIAFDIVTTYGMSDGLRFVRFGYDDYGNKVFSEKTHQRIDAEIMKIINEQMERATGMVRERRGDIERLSKKLLEKDVLSFMEVVEVLGERPFKPRDNFKRFLDEVLGKPGPADTAPAN